MHEITVNKADLLAKIQQNREEHKALYDEAVQVYTERFVAEARRFADDAVARAARGVGFANFTWLPVPEEHTDDFDRAIEMLEWEIGDEITLSEHDFATLVQNEWGWARSFTQNTTSYVGGR